MDAEKFPTPEMKCVMLNNVLKEETPDPFHLMFRYKPTPHVPLGSKASETIWSNTTDALQNRCSPAETRAGGHLNRQAAKSSSSIISESEQIFANLS
ncbi:Hypothetical protein SMAX5B_020493 [Scophthalmus maximus]|uniref:Uncharacterized protein n=1 Tax=Scophthalmus maximus TaxID=52904 RepID=A0A2U9C1V8_SCOMX|nr:Hypothetical protein SMAX5B_020493 [Scophthalmus maximus]